MANRLLYNSGFSFVKKKVSLFASVAIGASGAPTLSTALSRGIASISRVSAGLYTVTLQDRYQGLLGVRYTLVLASGSPAAFQMAVRANSVTAATPTLQVGFIDAAGAAVDIANGTTLLLKIELNDSTV
jgi:hypothetical protein